MCILRLLVMCTFMISLPLDPKKPNLFVLASSTSTTTTSASTSSAFATSDIPSSASATSDSTSPASATSDSTSPASATSDSTSPASATSDSTSPASATSDSTSPASATSDSTSPASATSDSTSPASATSDSTSPASATSDSTSPASATSDSTSSASATSDIPSSASATSDIPSSASATSDIPSPASATSDIPSSASATSDIPSPASATSDIPSSASATSDIPSSASATSDSTSSASATSDSTSSASATSDIPSSASATSDSTSSVSATSDSTSSASATSDDTSTVPNTSDDTSVGQNTSNNSSSDSITSKATSTVLTSTATATVLTSTATPTTTTAYTLTRIPVANLPFRIKFNNSLYNDSLKDNNSPYYKQVSDNYKTQLTNAWNQSTPGFEAVVIKSFRLGSLIVDYIVIIKVNKDNMTELLDNLNFTVLPHLERLEDADEDYLKSRFESDIEDELGALRATKYLAKFQVVDAQKDLCNLNNACPEGWQCKDLLNSLVLCTSPCANKSCNNGICSFDIDKKAKCSCKKDDHYIYGGDDCSEKAEKLTMESETIIAIAAGVGGGLILILLVALIVTCCRRKSPKDKMGESSQMSMLPMTEIGDDDAALITRDMSLNTDLATSRLYRDTKAAPSNLRDVVPIAEIGSFEDDGRSRSGREMRYGDDGRLYHSIPENQIYDHMYVDSNPDSDKNVARYIPTARWVQTGATSAGRGYTNKALEGDNDQAVAYFYQPEKLNRFGMESSDVNRKRQDEMARYSSAPTRDDRSQYISDSAPKREIEPDYFDWSNGAPRSSQEPRFTHTNIDKANAGDPRGHYKSGVDPRTHQQPSSRPYSPDSSAPSYYNDPPQRSNVYDYILAEKPVAIRRPTLMPQKR